MQTDLYSVCNERTGDIPSHKTQVHHAKKQDLNTLLTTAVHQDLNTAVLFCVLAVGALMVSCAAFPFLFLPLESVHFCYTYYVLLRISFALG